MTDSQEVVKCPLCEGTGKLRRDELKERLSQVESKSEVESSEADAEFATVGSGPARDFQKDVHTWNPQLPMWRRSPKE